MTDTQHAFVLRIAPSGNDRFQEALGSDEIIIGWSRLPKLRDQQLTRDQFRDLISREYHRDDPTMHRAGGATGDSWRFIRDMQIGDLVVVPHGKQFFVAEVQGDVEHRADKVEEDTAFRRKVEWLNTKRGIDRSLARSALQLRMKFRRTCVAATDLLEEIKECVVFAVEDERPDFAKDLRKRLIKDTSEEIRNGRLSCRGFERLVAAVMTKQGASNVKIIPTKVDKGVDILATFGVAGAFRFVVGIQAKHYQPDPPVGANVVEELIRGIEAESADLGMIATCGTISDDATERAGHYSDETGIRIEMVDGDLLAAMIVEGGLVGGSLVHDEE